MTAAPTPTVDDRPVDAGAPRRPVGWIVATSVISTAIFAPMVWRAVFRSAGWYGAADDYPWHLTVIMDAFEQRQGPPHFLLHLSIWIVRPLTGHTTTATACYLVLLASVAAFAAVCHAFVRERLGPARSEAWALVGALMIQFAQSPAALPGPSTLRPGSLWLPLNGYSNPTALFMRPFALGLFIATYRILGAPDSERWRARATVVGVPVLAVAGALAKPSLTIVIIPAVVVILLAQVPARGWRASLAHPALRLVALPSVGALILQACIVTFVVPPQFRGLTKVAPFQVIEHFHLFTVRFFIGALLPLVGLALLGRAFRRGWDVRLGLVCAGIGLIWFVMLQEDNTNGINGLNMVWGLQISLLLLAATTIRAVLAASLECRWRLDWRLGAVWFVVVLYLAAGLLDWSSQIGLAPVAWR